MFFVRDISPIEKTHILGITNNHYQNILDCETDITKSLVNEVIDFCRFKKIEEFYILTRAGKSAGQEVMHLHIHILSKQDTEN